MKYNGKIIFIVTSFLLVIIFAISIQGEHIGYENGIVINITPRLHDDRPATSALTVLLPSGNQVVVFDQYNNYKKGDKVKLGVYKFNIKKSYSFKLVDPIIKPLPKQ